MHCEALATMLVNFFKLISDKLETQTLELHEKHSGAQVVNCPNSTLLQNKGSIDVGDISPNQMPILKATSYVTRGARFHLHNHTEFRRRPQRPRHRHYVQKREDAWRLYLSTLFVNRQRRHESRVHRRHRYPNQWPFNVLRQIICGTFYKCACGRKYRGVVLRWLWCSCFV